MKKLLIYASAVGMATGVIFWLWKTKIGKSVDNSLDHTFETPPPPQNDAISQEDNTTKDMYGVKDESVHSVYTRHLEAGKIMKYAYRNIMEDFVEDPSDKNTSNKDDITEEIVTAKAPNEILKEIDTISKDLDALLE